MDDRELMELARMALESEELESPRSRLRLAGTAPAHVRAFRLAGGLIAAAACLATAVVILAPRPTSNGVPIAKGPETGVGPSTPNTEVATVAAHESGDQCMLLAVFRGPDGVCDCMQWKRQEWEGGKKLADVGRTEFVDAVMKAPCTTSAERIVVVALEGPADSMPRSREAVEQIANRIAAAAPSWHEDVSSYASAAMSGLPKGSTVVAKSIAMNR